MQQQDQLEQEKQNLERQIEGLRKTVEGKNNFIQQTQLVLKLKESRIAMLQKGVASHDADKLLQAEISDLKTELEILKEQLKNPPQVTQFAMENLQLRDALELLQGKLHLLEGDEAVAKLKEQNRCLYNELKCILTEKGTLLDELQRSQDEVVKQYLSEIKALRTRVQTLEAELDKNKHLFSEQLKVIQSQNLELETLVKYHQDIASQLQIDLDRHSEQKLQLEIENSHLHFRIQELESKVTQQGEQVIEASKQEASEDVILEYKRQAERHQEEMKKLQAKLEQYEGENRRKSTAFFNLGRKSLLKSPAKPDRRLSVQEEMQFFHLEQENSKKDIEIQKLADELSTMKDERDTLLEESQFKDAQLRESSLVAEKLQKEISSLEGRLAVKDEILASKEVLIKQQQEMIDQRATQNDDKSECIIHQLVSEKNQLQEHVASLLESQNALKEKTEMQGKDISLRDEEIVHLKQDYATLVDKLESFRDVLSRTRDALTVKEKEVIDFGAKLEELKQENSDLKVQQSHLLMKLDHVTGSEDETHKTAMEYQQRIVLLEKEIESWIQQKQAAEERALEAQQLTRVTLEKERNESKARFEEAAKKDADNSSAYQRTIQDLEAVLHKHEATIEEVSHKLSTLQGQHQQLEEEKLRHQKEAEQLMKDMQELRAVNSKLIGHNNQKQKIQHHVKIKEENNLLKREKLQLQEAMLSKDAQIRRLMEQMGIKKKDSKLSLDKENNSPNLESFRDHPSNPNSSFEATSEASEDDHSDVEHTKPKQKGAIVLAK